MRSTWSMRWSGRPGAVRSAPRRWGIALVTAVAVTATVAAPAAAEEIRGRRHRVSIEGFRFVPARVVAAPGDTVVWVNRDLVPHTLTARDESWDSRELPANARWELHITETTAGEYFCRYHPAMHGRVAIPAPVSGIRKIRPSDARKGDGGDDDRPIAETKR